MIILGLDYWQTITRDTYLFSMLASAILSEGGDVYIITAVGKERSKRVREDIIKTGVPHSAIEVVVFSHPREAPELKLEVCQRLEVDLFIDDRRDICELLNKNGILAANLLRKDNRDYDKHAYHNPGNSS